MRDGGLKGIEAVIKRQQRVTTKRDDGRFLSLRKNRRTGLLWACLEIVDRLSFTPLRNGLGIDPVFAVFDPLDQTLIAQTPGSASRAKLAIIRAGPRTGGGLALIIAALTACVVVALP